jgi:hypothetical protein
MRIDVIAQLMGDMFEDLWIVLLFWGIVLVAILSLITAVIYQIAKRREAVLEQRDWLARKRRELEVDDAGPGRLTK